MKNFSGRIMNFRSTTKSAPDQNLPDFIDRFLKYYGAVVEKKEEGFEVLLPEKLCTILGTTEHIFIPTESEFVPGKESGFSPDNVLFINYGSEPLEKIVNAVCSQVPLLVCQLQFNYLKSGGFEALIKETLTFSGSVGKIESWATVNTNYVFLTCKYLAQSDEQKEGLFSLAFSLDTGARILGMTEGFFFAEKTYPKHRGSFDWENEQIGRIMASVEKSAEEVVINEISSFQESMNRRFRRDVTNLLEYYDGLENEMKMSLERTGLSDQLIRDRQEKIAQIPEELARKKEDLYKKYSIRIKIQPCTVMVVTTPAVKVLYRASIGKKAKSLSLIYNPVSKAIDPLICEGCGRTTANILFCDRLHILCPHCGSYCPVCRT